MRVEENLITFHTYRKVLVIISLVFCLFSSVYAYSGGSGTETDPYQIAAVSDWNDLMHTSADWNKCFIMTADVNLQGVTLTPVGSSDLLPPFIPFTGVFDGNNHIIRNAELNMPGNSNVGLFGYVGSAGRVCNLSVEDVNIIGGSYVGGLAGMNDGNIADCCATGAITGRGSGNGRVGGLVGRNTGNINACYATSTVIGGSYVGGLVGSNSGTITNCYAIGAVTGGGYVGGLAGISNGNITNSYATGAVIGSDGKYGCAGGLVGQNNGGITVCYATGTIDGRERVGGLVGSNSGTINNCYAAGAVNGYVNVGGLVGFNSGTINNCYALGMVTGSGSVGGLVGDNYSGTITACFWDVNTSGQTTSAGGEGKTTTEMQTLSTFTSAGWDFSYTDGDKADWFIQIDEYPILTWQISPADIYTDGRNNFRDFAIFAQYWMRDDCAIYNYYCDWADLDFNGSVDVDDLIVLMSYWLETGIY